MDNQPTEDVVQDQYQMMEEKSAASVPIPPTPAATSEVEIPVYSSPAPTTTTAPMVSSPAPVQTMHTAPVESTIETAMDVLVVLFTSTRLIAGISLINAAGNIYAQNPGVNYLVAGILLFASFITEFLAKAINPITFGTNIIAALMIVIGGTMAFDRRDINIDLVGIMWFVAAILLMVGHSYDIIVGYGKVNVILLWSKIAAIIGSLFFCIGGIIMYSLEEVGAENIHQFANMFTFGGIAYTIHAITIGTGHQVVLDRVFQHAQSSYQTNAAQLSNLNPPMV